MKDMKRFLILLTAMALTTASLWATGDDEVIVTRQLTSGQRNALPEKTIAVETKRLTPAKRADAGLLDAIIQVLDTISQEDYQNRTFVLLLEPKSDGEVSIAVRSDDIVSRGQQDASIYYGDLEHGRYHYVALTNTDNRSLLEQTFKRQGKVKFVQEFEFVQHPTPRYPTNVIGTWSAHKGLTWHSVVINDDPNRDPTEIPAATLE